MIRENKGRTVFTSSAEKILCHLDRLVEFSNTGMLRPVTLDINPTNRCNLNCKFCSTGARDKTITLTLEQALLCTREYFGRGLRSVELTGGGEPTLWPHFKEYIQFTKGLGLKLGLITNGLKLHEFSPEVLGVFDWIRVSLNGVVDHNMELKYFEIPENVLFSFNYVWHEKSHWDTSARELLGIVKDMPRAVLLKIQVDVFSNNNFIIPEFPNEKRIFVTDKGEERVPEKCWMGAIKPHLCADGYLYQCSTCCLARRYYPETHRIGKWDELPPVIVGTFDTSLCDRCFAGNQNDLLRLVHDGLLHGDFL